MKYQILIDAQNLYIVSSDWSMVVQTKLIELVEIGKGFVFIQGNFKSNLTANSRGLSLKVEQIESINGKNQPSVADLAGIFREFVK